MVDFASIYQMANKPAVPLEQPIDAMGRALQLQHLAGQNQMTQMDLQQKQIALQRQQAYSAALQGAAGGQPNSGQAQTGANPQQAQGSSQQPQTQGSDLGSYLPASIRQSAALQGQVRQQLMSQGMWGPDQESAFMAQQEKLQTMATSNLKAQQDVQGMAKAERDQMVTLSQRQGDTASKALTETDPAKRAAILQDGLTKANDIFAPQPGDSAALVAYKQKMIAGNNQVLQGMSQGQVPDEGTLKLWSESAKTHEDLFKQEENKNFSTLHPNFDANGKPIGYFESNKLGETRVAPGGFRPGPSMSFLAGTPQQPLAPVSLQPDAGHPWRGNPTFQGIVTKHPEYASMVDDALNNDNIQAVMTRSPQMYQQVVALAKSVNPNWSPNNAAIKQKELQSDFVVHGNTAMKHLADFQDKIEEAKRLDPMGTSAWMNGKIGAFQNATFSGPAQDALRAAQTTMLSLSNEWQAAIKADKSLAANQQAQGFLDPTRPLSQATSQNKAIGQLLLRTFNSHENALSRGGDNISAPLTLADEETQSAFQKFGLNYQPGGGRKGAVAPSKTDATLTPEQNALFKLLHPGQ